MDISSTRIEHTPPRRSLIGPSHPFRSALVFCSPALVVYSLFMVWPLVASLRLSFLNDAGRFIGFDNFVTLFIAWCRIRSGSPSLRCWHIPGSGA